MPYETSVLQQAQAQHQFFLKDKQKEKDLLKERAYAAKPRIAEIDQMLRQTASILVKLTLQRANMDEFEKVRLDNLALQEERKDLLHSLDINPDLLNEGALCSACHDTGWQGKNLCSCLKTHCIQAQIQHLQPLLHGSNHSFKNFSLDYYSNEAWANGQVPQVAMKKIFDFCRQYSHYFDTFPNKNLLFIGKPGLGKTFLSGCIAREATLQGYSVVYGTAEQVFQAFQTRQFRRNYQDEYETAQNETRGFLCCDLLILDDLGTEFTTSITDATLYDLVNTRLMAGLHTVISTNLSVEELGKSYPPQIHSRLRGDYHEMNFIGEDIRQLKKANF